MGQKVGKAHFTEAAKPFLNLSLPAIEALWEAFNDLADGFGVSQYEFKEICAELTSELGINRVKMDERSSALFWLMDQDKNGLVDGIEFISTLAAVSGMQSRQLLEFIFTCYDFDGTGQLTIDEVTLAFKGTATGLCKLSGHKAPPEEELELLALEAFEVGRRKETDKMPIPELIGFCMVNPESKSWLEFYNDADEIDLVLHDVLEGEVDYQQEAMVPERSLGQVAKTEDDRFLVEYADNAKFMAALPWVDTIDALTPSEYIANKPTGSAPDAVLHLEWVHGYRGNDVRNNVRYMVDGSVVYHAARVGVVYNASQHRQRFMMEHTDEIVSLALHPEGQIVATGEAGFRPKILVWDGISMAVLATLKGFHRRAVTHVAFSQDGKKLASVGQDKYSSLAVYDWKAERLIYTARTTQAKVLGCVFAEADTIVTCGVNHIFFWLKEDRGFAKKRGIFGTRGKMQPIASLCVSGSRVISGTVGGSLYMWVGRNCAKVVKGHMSCVNALKSAKTAIISGSKDMRIRLWTLGLEPGPTFNMAAFGACPSIRSVDMSADGLRLLLGTKGCEIYEVSAADGSDTHGGPITIGHYEHGLAGLTVHPSKTEFATVGHDRTVRVWDAPTKSMIRMATLDTAAQAIAYSPDGAFLVVGLGVPGQPDPFKKAGAFVVLNEGDLTLVHEARDSNAPILDARFSPDGQTMALASADHGIYLYAPTEEYEVIARCRKHTDPVVHLDFSEDSEWLQSNCLGNQLYFVNTEKGSFQSDMSAMKDVAWATQTCTMAWPTQGAYPTEADHTEVLCCDRSNTGEVLAVGDSFGRIRLYQYPCVVRNALYHQYQGHGFRVTRVRFLSGDSHLISVGDSDRCVFQWKFEEDDELDDADVVDESESDGYRLDMRDGSDLDRPKEVDRVMDEYGDSAAIDLQPLPEKAPPPAPWLSSVSAPKDAAPSQPNTPVDGLELEWVHGYRGHDSRNNLRYSAEGRIVYPAAGVGVSLHTQSYTQSFNTEHTDEVVCLAIHPSLKYAATGQVGRKPTIVVWDAETGETLQVMAGFHRRAVCQLAFSPDGRYLASVGQDSQHSLAVYEWREGLIKASTVTNTRKVLGLAWDPSSRAMVQCGLKHVTFWEMEGRNLCYHKGLIGRQGVSQAFVSAAYLGKQPIIGSSDGHLYVFDGCVLSRTIKAHESAIYALYAYEAGLLTGGKDGVIKKWDVDLQCTSTFDTLAPTASSSSPSLRPRIRSLCLSADRRKMLVGTAGNEVFELSAFNGADGHNGPLVSCAFRGQLWGLAVHPKKNEVAVVGDDGAVRTYSLESRRPLQRLMLDSAARAIAYSPSGKHLAVGLGRGKKSDKSDGGLVVLDGDKLSIIHETRDSNEWIRVACYSPDGQALALGSEDNKVYVYNVKDMYSRRFVLSSHRAPVTQLDFSEDGMYLQSVDKAQALVFTDMVTGLHIPSALTVKDVPWASWSLPYGWPVQGLWPTKRAADGSEPLCVSRSESRKLVAVGDSLGRVRLYHYPLLDEAAGYRYFRGHGLEVRKVAWSRDDSLVLTAGGQDMCVLQWRHVADLSPESGDEAKDEEGDDMEVVAVDGGLLSKLDPPRDPREKPRPATGWNGKWMKAMVAPSNIPAETDDPPAIELELEHVHGVRSEDVRGNVKYNDRNDIVWHTGATGVIYDQVNHRQDFYLGHRHDIISLTVSHDGKYVATGEAAESPRVRIWDSSAGAEIAELPGVHVRGIPIVAFSRDGRYLASVGQDRHHTVAVYKTYNGLWCDARRVATEKCSQSKMLFAVFAGEQAFPLMVGGVKTVMFLSLDHGRALRMRKAVFGSRHKVQPVLCGVYLASDDVVVTGTVNGQLYFWKDRRVAKVVQAHTGSVYAVAQAELGLVTGGKDGLVKLWDRNMAVTRTFAMCEGADPLPYHSPVHSVCCNRNFTKVVVGMRGGEVYEVGISSGKRVLITESHSRKQLRGLAANPANPDQYATIGDDGVLRLWSLSLKRAVRRLKLDGSSRALGWSQDGKRLAIGFGGSGGDPNVTSKDGALMVVDGATLEVVFEDRRCKQTITDIKFSRSGNLLALACEDGKVYIHDTAKNYNLRVTTAKASDEIRWIDLTESGEVLQAATADADLMLFDAKDGSRIGSVASQRDARWDTITCPYGWFVQGVWPRQEVRGYDVTSVERSHDHKLLAVSCADGEVRVYAHPAQTLPMKRFVTARGHGQMAARVRFSGDDQHLVSLDAYAGSVFTYRVVPRPPERAAAAEPPAAKKE